TILVGAIFVFYLVYPAVVRLRRRMPLWASNIIVYVVLLAVVGGALAYFIPTAANNVRQFAHDVPALSARISAGLVNPNVPLVRGLPPEVTTYIASLPMRFAQYFRANAGVVTSGAFHTVVTIVEMGALFIIIPIVGLYLLLESHGISGTMLSMVPRAKRTKTAKVLSEIHVMMESYIRGQVLVAAIVGILITILLSIVRVPYAAALGLIAGFLEIIPYAGAVIGGAIAVILALVVNGPLSAVIVLGGLVVINQLEGHVIAPLVVGKSVRLAPLTIVIALLTGAELFGIIGMLVAVPIAGIIKVLVENYAVQD
ncbi:MAG TPA: AI-2E family transporter, partial [Candidatus Baltobacteraceae bacterium]|nr:AI-2E family transporter [Candidatus Baltobacteraceae bacterium]